MIFLQLFLVFMQIGLLSIGGGYASLSAIKTLIVDQYQWITMQQYTDLITISEMTPGPIAINSATFVGVLVGGVPGAIVATVGFVLPSFIIVLILAKVYFKYKNLNVVQHTLQGIRPAMVGLIAQAAFSIVVLALFGGSTINFNTISYVAVGVTIVGLFAMRKWKLNPIIIIFGSGVVGIISYLITLIG